MIGSESELRAYLDRLAKLGAPDLRAEWTRVYERPAPRRISKDLLIRGIAYRVQEQMYGGLKPATVKKLKEIAAALKEGRDLPEFHKRELHPGARLIREWAGKTHIVEVIPNGFAWSGRTYRSLTQITHLITGAHRSGPRFFGMRDKRRRPDADSERIAERLK